MEEQKALKKLGVKNQDIVVSHEQILLYPRDLIYSILEPDSVGYLSCISTNRNEFKSYFENNFLSYKVPVGSVVIRGSGDYIDSVKFDSLKNLSLRFFSEDFQAADVIESEAKFVIIFFWNPQTIDRLIIRNYKFYRKYISKHPELNIQLLAVLNE
ncbi:MAG: hypothetical protein A2W91_02615 [Bacteroidetes bacterium GWF2_38_335]|nr:MAG: hypothetical protein A2W91_02615 [Bacteroidetes bacterium GWF2_38_335]OFY77611.1 MAG: hypothetical protein A2281_02145 [Bacteroidetes bacterium RIFOXYA12_FULL_38_20]HBS87085.1 hypothetical protein [Bacteroidales bacterium]